MVSKIEEKCTVNRKVGVRTESVQIRETGSRANFFIVWAKYSLIIWLAIGSRVNY